MDGCVTSCAGVHAGVHGVASARAWVCLCRCMCVFACDVGVEAFCSQQTPPREGNPTSARMRSSSCRIVHWERSSPTPMSASARSKPQRQGPRNERRENLPAETTHFSPPDSSPGVGTLRHVGFGTVIELLGIFGICLDLSDFVHRFARRCDTRRCNT